MGEGAGAGDGDQACQETSDLGEGEMDEPGIFVPGSSFPAVAAVTVRKAWASIASVTCRYQAP
jgi:hypothetical protein